MIKQIVTIILAALLLATCGNKEQQLKERTAELCKYIPDHELKAESKPFMTTDFYAVLDTMMASTSASIRIMAGPLWNYNRLPSCHP